ncbi:MAG: bile acid:sodium symporter, partial [Candidatus Saccharimonadales bacterium]
MLEQRNMHTIVIETSALAQKVTHFIHQRFLLLLISAYVLAGILPLFGLWLRHIQLGQVNLPDGSSVKISLSLLMLSFLLFNAGLGIQVQELTGLWKRPIVIGAGFVANMAVPILLVLGLRGVMQFWHSSDELQNLLVGLAMIVSMPIAGSSTAWSQNANGNLSLSLGLVFLSTLFSPLTTPLVLHVFGGITTGDFSEDLIELASQGTNAFMMLTVVFPSILGILVHFGLGEEKTALIKPFLKLANFIV